MVALELELVVSRCSLAEEDLLDEEWLALPLSEVERLLALAVGSLSIRCCAMAFLVLVVTRFVCLR